MNRVVSSVLKRDLEHFFAEDDLSRNFFYMNKLPNDEVLCSLNFKSEMIVSGLPWFFESFRYLGFKDEGAFLDLYEDLEGKLITKNEKKSLEFKLPFSIAVTGERIALNLLQHASSISTFTEKFVKKAKKYKISILDTRKTTPGLRSLEKYAVVAGGGYNHRMGQADLWMVKDNHKSFFGGIKEACDFFKSIHGFYTPIEVEIHSLDELKEAVELKIKHVMLDNFSTNDVLAAIKIKPDFMTFEISGGVRLDTIDDYLISGVDAISIGALTYAAPQVDLSLKYRKV